MQVNVKGTNFQLTTDITDYLEKKLAAAEKFVDEAQGTAICDVELEHEHAQHHGPVFRAEVNLNAHGSFIRVEAEGESMNAAIDTAHDELLRRLRKGKMKTMSRLRRGGERLKAMLRGEKGEQ